ncbi:cutinase [Mycolicibacterium insubricum]|jgi:cutinase|uniref:Cutinase n=1 Tax=Mycolicibacterium insubricum TaxID=444597 RepID=A0A1X0DNY6_9MYCO|nr:cutinase family protein [Mycolicibacterium insubricum]MCV7083244.1 cutinase family protein [Mycolicibacterium insubricum]ORA74131.1 cutinase [Mycolicibacterium insubricum]BBZ67831.1 cutinase [Mycolicibacterium insubricum]
MLSRLSLSGLLAAAVLTPLSVAAAPAAIADDCPRAELVFARGTAEAPGLGLVGDALAAALTNKVSGMGTYAVNYPASYNFLNTQNGANDAAAHIAWMADNCPNTKIVLGGYSQGAAAMSMLAGVPPVGERIGMFGSAPALAPDLANNVAAVAVFGNPGRRFGEPLSSNGQFAGRTIDLCSPGDPICSDGRDRSAHSNYEQSPYPQQAASFIAARV